MGLTFQSTQRNTMADTFHINKSENQFIIALAGNPNTGKSTVFNSLTGLHQHTGNWPGKTVSNARGIYTYQGRENILVDLPGTYSLFASSIEEEIARDFLCFGNYDAVIVIVDGTCLERNLSLVFQIMELTNRVVLCINLIDEVKKRNIVIDHEGLQRDLGIPVVLCSARNGIGMEQLKETVYHLTSGHLKPEPKIVTYTKDIEEKISSIQPFVEQISENINPRWISLRFIDGDSKFIEKLTLEPALSQNDSGIRAAELAMTMDDRKSIRDTISEQIYRKAEELKTKYVSEDSQKYSRDRRIDQFITSRIFGFPLMLLMLALVFWLTITGANFPSSMLANFLFKIEDYLMSFAQAIKAPAWAQGVFILGLYRTFAWVVSVMLPPMAIFFPLFTFLEDLGYLPRVAFNMDHLFKKACAHGKQCLTMCMGFGCNAAGVISCRIVDSPRERLIAVLTNNFVPCNGRFPTLIAISSIFFVIGSRQTGIMTALAVTLLIVLGIGITLAVSYLLSKTILRGVPSTFTLELPPYRIPKVGHLLYTSLIDRTIFVLLRAIIVAAPAGAITWILGNIYIGDLSIISHIAAFFDPFAQVIGLDGFIIMAFILGLPANEIVLPILLMAYLSTGSMIEYDSLEALKTILTDHGWTRLTALNTMLFCLLHWPCATTLLTIRKETGSLKWTALAALIPTTIAIGICFLTSTIFRLLGWA